VTALPRELARWEEDLAFLPRDVAARLAPWVGRLSLALGPFASSARSGEGEPDGVGSISRRGSYERLLASEWLLAAELPDEFLRRAAGGEHLFLAPARRAPSAARVCTVVFDAGPSQIGAPRIVHVALLLVLARRARAAGARFEWGVLQKSGLRSDDGAPAVRALLDARSAREATDAAVGAWIESLSPGPDRGSRSRADRGDSEIWIVGALRTTRRFPRLPRISVEDPIDPSRRAIDVKVERRGRGPIAIELALPPDDACARLVRDPLRAAAPAPGAAHVRRGARLGFSADGRRLVATSHDEIVSWPVPNSPRAPLGAPRRLGLRSGETLLAYGHAGRKQLFAVTLADGALAIYGLGIRVGSASQRARIVLALGDEHAVPDPAWPPDFMTPSIATLGALTRAASRPEIHYVDPRGALVELAPPKKPVLLLPQGVHVPGHGGVCAFTATRRGILAVARALNGGTELVAIDRPIGASRQAPVVLARHVSSARVAFIGSMESLGVIAFSSDSDLVGWRLYAASGAHFGELIEPSDSKIVGVHLDAQGPGIVLVGPTTRRQVSVVGRSHSRSIATASGPIEEAIVSPRGGLVAWRTSDGTVEVASIAHSAIVARLAPKEDA
jgi:hypothetical protein